MKQALEQRLESPVIQHVAENILNRRWVGCFFAPHSVPDVSKTVVCETECYSRLMDNITL
jgi:hypothetical protein